MSEYAELTLKVIGGTCPAIESLADDWPTDWRQAFEIATSHVDDFEGFKEAVKASLNGAASSILSDIGNAVCDAAEQELTIGSIGIEELDKYPDPSWLVDGLIADGGLCVFSGDGGHGKSWLALTLALAVASGEKWLGHFAVRRGGVLIIDEENSPPLLKSRKNLLMAGLGLKHSDLSSVRLVLHRGVDFMPTIFPNKTVQRKPAFNKLVKEIELWQPALIIVDSLRACHTGKEDSSDDIRPVMQAIRLAASYAGNSAGILAAHHVNKQGKFRGSIDIKQNANCLFEVEKTGDVISLTCSKMRDGLEPMPFQVNLVHDENSVKLEYAGKRNPVAVFEWLCSSLRQNGDMSREDLIKLASKDNICKQRRLDDELKYREGTEDIESYKTGRTKFYRVVLKEEDKIAEELLSWLDGSNL